MSSASHNSKEINSSQRQPSGLTFVLKVLILTGVAVALVQLLIGINVLGATVSSRLLSIKGNGSMSHRRWRQHLAPGVRPGIRSLTDIEPSKRATEIRVAPPGLKNYFVLDYPGLAAGATSIPPALAGSWNASNGSEPWLLNNPPQGPELDYSNFKHSTQRHASLGCNSCHDRTDNSATPRFPGHKACTGCHLAQFVTPNVPMCVICHTAVSGSNPPLKSFPARFNENFNVEFDHAQHMTGSARPPSGCSACHGKVGGRAAALRIPAGISAHNQCYACHTPSSKSSAGREIASCGVCHDQKTYSRTSMNARAFRFAFSHAKHGPGQRLGCTDCHSLTAGAPQSRQVSSPAAFEHFPATRGKTCLSCHNGKRSFGGDLAFKDCRRCHTATSFKMPM